MLDRTIKILSKYAPQEVNALALAKVNSCSIRLSMSGTFTPWPPRMIFD